MTRSAAYLAAEPEGGRHARRVEKIAAIERQDSEDQETPR